MHIVVSTKKKRGQERVTGEAEVQDGRLRVSCSLPRSEVRLAGSRGQLQLRSQASEQAPFTCWCDSGLHKRRAQALFPPFCARRPGIDAACVLRARCSSALCNQASSCSMNRDRRAYLFSAHITLSLSSLRFLVVIATTAKQQNLPDRALYRKHLPQPQRHHARRAYQE